MTASSSTMLIAPENGIGQGLGVSSGDQQPLHSGGDAVLGARVLTSDHRQPGRHRFEQRQREPFVDGWKDEQIGFPQAPGNLSGLQNPREPDVVCGPVYVEDAAREGQLGIRERKLLPCRYQVVDAFGRLDPPDVADAKGIAAREPQTGGGRTRDRRPGV